MLRKPPRRTNNVAGRPIPRQLAARPTCALLALFPVSITNWSRLSSSISARTCRVHFIPNESSGSLREIFEAKLKLVGDTARAGMMLFLGKLFISLSSLGGERTVAIDDSDDDEIERGRRKEEERERGERFDYGKEGRSFFLLMLGLDDWTRKGIYLRVIAVVELFIFLGKVSFKSLEIGMQLFFISDPGDSSLISRFIARDNLVFIHHISFFHRCYRFLRLKLNKRCFYRLSFRLHFIPML